MRDATEQKDVPRDAIGVVPTRFSTHGPKTVPRIDYGRIFVLDSKNNLLGEYVLDDDCPLESSDLIRSLPLNGMRHLVSFYQGEYAFTPFKVDDLWFVVLTRGVPRIEERGSVGTLLAAARIHIPPMMEPLLAKREMELRTKERDLADRESELQRREQRSGAMESELRVSSARLAEIELDLRAREAKVATLRDYAVQLQRALVPPKDAKPKEATPVPALSVTPA